MGVSAIVGLGNKSDIDEDDLLAFFEQDPNTNIIAQHCEDLKDGRAFAEAAKRVSKKKPVVVLKAGRTSAGAKAASSHTGALAGNDKIYEDVLKQSGVIRARSLRQLLEFARGIPVLPTPKGENVLIITGAGGSGVLLSDAVVDNGLSLMTMPPDLDAAFRKFIPPFGAAGNPVDITGGEPPITYVNTVKLGLEDERIHSLILGYWHTIVTPPMVFAKNMVEIKNAMKAKGIDKPIVASLAGDIEVEEAAEYLYQNGIPAYAYSTELPVEVLGAKYKWARGAGLLKGTICSNKKETPLGKPGGVFYFDCNSVCHHPRKRVIQYTPPLLSLLDRPVKPGDDSGEGEGATQSPSAQPRPRGQRCAGSDRSLPGCRRSSSPDYPTASPRAVHWPR
jgi:acyl-CoA synthetase (NDP forming)